MLTLAFLITRHPHAASLAKASLAIPPGCCSGQIGSLFSQKIDSTFWRGPLQHLYQFPEVKTLGARSIPWTHLAGFEARSPLEAQSVERKPHQRRNHLIAFPARRKPRRVRSGANGRHRQLEAQDGPKGRKLAGLSTLLPAACHHFHARGSSVWTPHLERPSAASCKSGPRSARRPA